MKPLIKHMLRVGPVSGVCFMRPQLYLQRSNLVTPLDLSYSYSLFALSPFLHFLLFSGSSLTLHLFITCPYLIFSPMLFLQINQKPHSLRTAFIVVDSVLYKRCMCDVFKNLEHFNGNVE